VSALFVYRQIESSNRVCLTGFWNKGAAAISFTSIAINCLKSQLVALHRRIAAQLSLAFLPIGHKGMQEQLEDFSVPWAARSEQVNQFMHNYELAQLLWQRQQQRVER
jgi:hypothetical protein